MSERHAPAQGTTLAASTRNSDTECFGGPGSSRRVPARARDADGAMNCDGLRAGNPPRAAPFRAISSTTPSNSTDPMAKNTLSFVCQNCGAAYNRWQGKCESCGEWNTLAEEDADRQRAGLDPLQAQGADVCAGEPVRKNPGRASPVLGHDRARPRHRRRLCPRLGAAGRRRSRHRQIDAAHPGDEPDGARRPSHRLHLRRRGDRAGAAARRAARAVGCAGAARRRNLGGGHRLDPVGRRSPAADRDRTRSRPCGPTRWNPRPAR